MYEPIGGLYRKAKKWDQAVTAYTAAQQRAPARGERLHYNLARVWHEKGDDVRALISVDAYLRTQPLGMDAYELKIELLRRSGKDAAGGPPLGKGGPRGKRHTALRPEPG